MTDWLAKYDNGESAVIEARNSSEAYIQARDYADDIGATLVSLWEEK
jgi:hypothetical protein